MVSKKEVEHDKMHHEDDKKHHKRELFFTVVIVALLVVVAYAFLHRYGVMDSDSGEAISRADLICFLSGFPGGVNQESLKHNSTGYIFNCSADNMEIKFDPKTGEGFIGHKNGTMTLPRV